MSPVSPITSRERLFRLLPSVYRVRDAAEGEPLRALLAVIQTEFERVEGDIEQLYENWFIETCEEWVVPYIGDLLGVRNLLPIPDGTFSQRAYVANTLAYRQAKGTVAVLEQLARDLTGWPASAVEFFTRLATTQQLNHIRLNSLATLDIRNAADLDLFGTPFERATRTADVRRIESGRGTHNIPNVGLFLWRLQSFHVVRGDARAIPAAGEGRYTFDPLGRSLPLFNRPRTETGIAQLAAEENVPGRLRRRALHDELHALREVIARGGSADERFWGEAPVLRIWADEQPIAPERIVICHLGEWRLPAPAVHLRADGESYTTRVAVDPVLGRLGFLGSDPPARVEVSYAYGFGGDLGGGPYDRRDSVEQWLDDSRPVSWQLGVTRDPTLRAEAPDPNQLVETPGEAIERWNTHVAEREAGVPLFGVIALMDSASYTPRAAGASAFPEINLPPNTALAIVAADWPVTQLSEGESKVRVSGVLVPMERRPHLGGDLIVQSSPSPDAPNPGELILDGLLVEGGITIAAGNLGRLRLLHSTLAPDHGGLTVEGAHHRLRIDIERSISGLITAPDSTAALRAVDSIFDAAGSDAIAAPGVDAELEACTLFGGGTFRTLEASNSLFTGTLRVARRQAGCVRFSYVPLDSLVPRRFRCQPANETDARRVAPQFVSTVFGDPGYAQLAASCPPEITAGADDEGEMGAFHFLHTGRRIRNLRASLDEYLRFGLNAGIFLVT